MSPWLVVGSGVAPLGWTHYALLSAERKNFFVFFLNFFNLSILGVLGGFRSLAGCPDDQLRVALQDLRPRLDVGRAVFAGVLDPGFRAQEGRRELRDKLLLGILVRPETVVIRHAIGRRHARERVEEDREVRRRDQEVVVVVRVTGVAVTIGVRVGLVGALAGAIGQRRAVVEGSGLVVQQRPAR